LHKSGKLIWPGSFKIQQTMPGLAGTGLRRI
jgi:hypothetical protein